MRIRGHSLLSILLEIRARLRGFFYRIKYQRVLGRAVIGRRMRVHGSIVIRGPGRVIFGENIVVYKRVTPYTYSAGAVISIGDRTVLHGTRMGAAEKISVGSDCLIGEECRIMDTDFHSVNRDRRRPGATVKVAPVIIGNNVWIGPMSGILKGVHIGENSVVGFGSVVTCSVEADTVVAGNPARMVKRVE